MPIEYTMAFVMSIMLIVTVISWIWAWALEKLDGYHTWWELWLMFISAMTLGGWAGLFFIAWG